jgi:TatA/E family protein of Tat protein translocase
MGFENPLHILFVAAVALVVLGPRRLPELARALGKGMREFREALSTSSEQQPPQPPAAPTQAAPAAPAQPVHTAAHAEPQGKET